MSPVLFQHGAGNRSLDAYWKEALTGAEELYSRFQKVAQRHREGVCELAPRCDRGESH